LLYVACTRARQRLHLFGNAKTNSHGALSTPVSNSLLSLLWPVIGEQFRQTEAQTTELDTAVDSEGEQDMQFDPHPVTRLSSSWQPPALNPMIATISNNENTSDDSEPIEFDWAGEVARISGIVVHQIFQQIDTIGWRKWQKQPFDQQAKEDCRNNLIENGLPVTLHAQAIELIERALANTKSDAHAAWIFDPNHGDIRREWPVTGLVNGRIQHAIIDRCFIADDEEGQACHWIVDFKTSRHDEAEDLEQFVDQERLRYKGSMEKYAEIVSALGADKVKTALYFPVLQRLEVLT